MLRSKELLRVEEEEEEEKRSTRVRTRMEERKRRRGMGGRLDALGWVERPEQGQILGKYK